MAIKLSSPRRWRPIFNFIKRERHVVVNFSSKHLGYIAAYRYVCKEKSIAQVLHSPGHPNLENAKSPAAKRGFTQASQMQLQEGVHNVHKKHKVHKKVLMARHNLK